MTVGEHIQKVRKILTDPPLSDIQELVFKMCWEGNTYTEIAAVSKYEESYIRDVGSKLWQRLSKKLNTKVSKNNLHVTLKMYLSNEPEILVEKKPKLVLDNTQKALNLNSAPRFSQFPSGIVPLNSAYYIPRQPYEKIAYQQVENPGGILRIKAPQKMGKSSLLIRIIDYAARQNYQTVYIDFKQADTTILQNINQFLRWFCNNVSYQLNQPAKLDDFWDLELGSKVSCTLYFQGYILEQLNRPLLIALNDIDELFKYPQIAQNFFPLLRFWHEQAHQVKTWQKLRLVMSYATENYVPLNFHQSPFNVGLILKLPSLTMEQVRKLSVNYGLNSEEQDFLPDLYTMVGGHPYLIRLAFYYLNQDDHNYTLEQLLTLAPTEEGIYSNHLRSLTVAIEEKPSLKIAVVKLAIAKKDIKLESSVAYQLESLGLISRQGNLVQFSSELYRLYFRDLLIRNHVTIS